jgi:peptidoglycan/xylan/chitin deacetylase (PgdA/CDA1 family)
MIGKRSAAMQTRPWTVLGAVLSFGFLTCTATRPASAADCPGHPDALGTSRTLVVDPREHTRIGTMQYAETLPLRDHEVVLSFDDGPLPHNSDQVLAILAAQCIKANFFIIGQMARTFPEGVRKLRDAGHTIGTHTQTHPLSMNRMPIERAKAEIDDGIASVKAALGADADKSLAPFFRIPGLLRAQAVEDYLASQGIQTWSADFPADDWRHISSQRVYDLAIQRIEAKGKGILLLHDIQARTVAALPRILQTLKARGYSIVHVVPATPERPATPTEPQQWQLHPTSETVAISHWPKIPNFVFVDANRSAVPSLSEFDGPNGALVPLAEPFDRAGRRGHGVPLPQQAPWPRQTSIAAASTAAALPIPAPAVFTIPELPHPTAEAVALLAPVATRTIVAGRDTDRTATPVNAGNSSRMTRGKLGSGRGGRLNASGPNQRGGIPVAAPARRSPLKHLVQVKKRNA